MGRDGLLYFYRGCLSENGIAIGRSAEVLVAVGRSSRDEYGFDRRRRAPVSQRETGLRGGHARLPARIILYALTRSLGEFSRSYGAPRLAGAGSAGEGPRIQRGQPFLTEYRVQRIWHSGQAHRPLPERAGRDRFAQAAYISRPVSGN